MALNLLYFSLKCSCNSNIFRAIKRNINFKRISWYSTDISNDKPVKYSSSKAFKVTISDNIDPKPIKDIPWIQPYAVLASFAAILIYFCILREENDIDELLKGNPEYRTKNMELVELKLHLAYCQKNNLPTAALKEKIEKLQLEISGG